MLKRGRFWFALVSYVFLLLVIFVLPPIEKQTAIQLKYESDLKMTCTLLSETWHGHPVYALENESEKSLNHVLVMSWSEQRLPILWVGSRSENEKEVLDSPVLPPVNLPAHQMIWFAGSKTNTSTSLRHFKIEWLENGREQSETVQPHV